MLQWYYQLALNDIDLLHQGLLHQLNRQTMWAVKEDQGFFQLCRIHTLHKNLMADSQQPKTESVNQ